MPASNLQARTLYKSKILKGDYMSHQRVPVKVGRPVITLLRKGVLPKKFPFEATVPWFPEASSAFLPAQGVKV